MSKKIKAANKEKNLQVKRARKAANKAKYAALMVAGKNSKSYRSIQQGKKSRKINPIDHPNGFCGNVGCIKCFPYLERRDMKSKTA